jgi:hypothetical protein
MNRLSLLMAAAVLTAGCQSNVVSPLVPLPLPVEPMPSTKLVIVGTGETAEAAREAAINQLVHQVILPPSEPESVPTAEFVASMIRGYNVAGVAQDFLGKYYVTVELTISQLGVNYQELYHANRLVKRELELRKADAQNEKQLRELAQEREQAARTELESQRRQYESRILALTEELEKLKKQQPKAESQEKVEGAKPGESGK